MRQGKPSFRAVAAIACLLGASLVAAQDGTITVTSPARGAAVFSDTPFSVVFEVSEGVTEPYDVDLFEHNGDKESVHNFCSWEHTCNIEGGSVSVTIPEDVVIGENYEVVVTERSSSLHGTSEAFELLEQPEEESSSVVEFRHVGGEGGAVGDMNTAMVVMASVCGVILLVAVCAASWFAARRRAAIADSKGMGPEHDIERNGMGYGDTSSRGHSNSSTPTYRRSMQSSTSLKNMHTPVSQHPYSSGPGMKGSGDSVTEYSSNRTLARGDTQRARSNSHDSRNGSDDSRIQMYSNSSRRGGDGYDDGGPVMLATTPGRSRTNSSSRTPGRSGSTGRSITPRQRSNSGSSRGRQMYNASNPPYEDGKDWGDPNRRRSSYSPKPRNRSGEGRDFDWRSWGGGGSRSRHRSGSGGIGSERPPRFDDGPAEYFGDRASMDAELPPRRSSRHRSPRGHQYRSRSQERSHGRSGGHGHSHGGGSQRSHILGYRRTSSGTRISPTRSSSESTDWTSEGSRRRNDRRDDRGRSMPTEEMGRRRGRRAHSTSSRARSRPELDGLDVEDGGRYDHRRREFDSRTAPNEGEWRRRRNFESPSRHSPYRSGMAESGVPPDVSWEELRSRYLRDKMQDPPRVTKTHSLPEYGDAIRESESLSTEGSNPFPSANHERVHSADGKPSAGGAGEQWHDGVSKDRGSNGSSGMPNLGMPATLSPSTRADSARAAARDAQMSAERALAAAATASRAADLAARAAMEAEAEAEAERYSAGGPLSMDNAEEVTASTLTPNTSIRGRLAAFSPGSARMAGSGDKNKEKQSTENTPEEVAGMTRSRSGRGRPDNSWVTARVRGPDTAGGSGGAGGSGSVGGVGGQAAKTGVGGGGVDGSGRDSSVDSVGDIGGVHGRRKHHERLGEDLAAKRRAFVRQYSGSTCDDSEISLFDNMTTGIGGRKQYLSMNSEITSFDESEYSFGEGMQAMEAYARRTSGAGSPLRRGGAAAAAAAATAAKDRVEIAVRRKDTPANGAPSTSPKTTKEAAATAVDKNNSEAASSLEPGVAAT